MVGVKNCSPPLLACDSVSLNHPLCREALGICGKKSVAVRDVSCMKLGVGQHGNICAGSNSHGVKGFLHLLLVL